MDEKIKDVALRVARGYRKNFWGMDGGLEAQYVAEFASRFMAELQKDAQPVAVVLADYEDADPVVQWLEDVREGDKLFLGPQPKAATVPNFNSAGRYCMSEDDCIAAGIDFAAYERGIADAIEACYQVAREAK